MLIPRISRPSRIGDPRAKGRRSSSSRRFALEPLEARTALSTGLHSGLAAMGAYRAEVDPALIGSVQAAWTAREAGVTVSVTFRSADAAPAAGRTGTLEDPDVQLFTETYANLLPVVSDLLTGLAGSIALLGQAYRLGIPVSDLLDSAAAAIGKAPADIPPDIIPLGAAAAVTAQEAGVALPDTVAELEGMAAGSQVGGWISAAVGRIEALAAVDGSTQSDQASIDGPPPALSTFLRGEGETSAFGAGGESDSGPLQQNPSAAPIPLGLLPLGRFFLANVNVIYSNYIEYFNGASDSMAARPDGFAPEGLASVSGLTVATEPEAQESGWAGAGGMSYAMTGWGGPAFLPGLASLTGRSGPALSQGSSSRSGEPQGPGSSPEEPVPPASITAGEVPLDILLSDPGSSTQDVSIGLEQMAELIPIEDSSLALVATLWTVPSDSRAEAADEGDTADEPTEPVTCSASPPPWAVFVIGLEEAFERSRDACGTTFPEGRRSGEGDGAGDVAEDRLESRCPIIPTAERTRRPDRAEGSSPDVGGGAVARPCPEDARPHDAAEGEPLTEGAVRSVWAASVSALVVGWFWGRRQRRRGWGLGGIGRTDHRRGGTEPSPDESP
jgi:hypothetical protein